MSESDCEEISVHKVFVEISKYLENEKLFERLQNALYGEQNYKLLLKTGENQFFDATNESSFEDDHRKSRLSYATINYLSQQVENDIDKIVQEKFQGEFLNTLKNKVLQAILQLSSNQTSSTVKASPSSAKSKKSERKPVFPLLENFSSSCVQNGNGKKKEHNVTNQQSEESNITNGHVITNLVAKLEHGYVQNTSGKEKEHNGQAENSNLTNGQVENSNIANGQTRLNWIKVENNKYDLDFMFPFDDVSSVHTSDLSSFEDEISVTSDEEFGEKRRLSLKEVQEKLESSQLQNMESEENNKQANNKQSQDLQRSSAANGNDSSKMNVAAEVEQKWSDFTKKLNCFNPLKKPKHFRERKDLRPVMPWMRALFPEATEQDKICGTCRKKISQLKKHGEKETSSMPSSSQDSFTVSQKSQRKRKPNLKYIYEQEVLPLKKKSTGKTSKSVCSDTPRKRGRPRKHST